MLNETCSSAVTVVECCGLVINVFFNENKFSETARNVEDTGVASVYDSEFEKMENTLTDLKKQLESANITRSDIIGLQNEIDNLRQNVFVPLICLSHSV